MFILVSIIVFLHSSRFGIVGPTLELSCEAPKLTTLRQLQLLVGRRRRTL